MYITAQSVAGPVPEAPLERVASNVMRARGRSSPLKPLKFLQKTHFSPLIRHFRCEFLKFWGTYF